MLIAVAASGGRDSTALLHCTLRMARPLGVHVVALHVHHGLMPQADEWVAHLRRQASRWARSGWPLTLDVTRLAGAPGRGDSVEAWARTRRYAALAAMAKRHGCDAVLLAHHREDQAETVLLQALRGAGAAGLAAMPARVERDGIVWLRPWLEVPGEAIAAYVKRWGLGFVEDPSNADPRFARSRLRRQVWPALRRAFPDAAVGLGAVARQARTAQACLAELAGLDAQGAIDGQTLLVAPWTRLSPARRANLLRHWLGEVGSGAAVPESLVARLVDEVPGASTGRWPLTGRWLRLYRGRLFASDAVPDTSAAPLVLDLSAPGRHRVEGWNGHVVVEPSTVGVPSVRLRAACCRARSGGEQFRLQPSAADRSLKKQYQALSIPAWHRDGPLIFDREELLFAPGLGINGRVLRRAEEGLVSLHWIADAPPPSAGRQRRGR